MVKVLMNIKGIVRVLSPCEWNVILMTTRIAIICIMVPVNSSLIK